ncbi:hypothetical protein BP6252_10018 [Coleophoma cylindrospora]|uniref:Uncharacterized protein n=1 Tax=Coleophoma cylindrospora TaxID=1849047 RepID=A0A3D8QX27_9HELO|nr:hypothetical protein BP6252_10018 [Coleophoma cylindrospora]
MSMISAVIILLAGVVFLTLRKLFTQESMRRWASRGSKASGSTFSHGGNIKEKSQGDVQAYQLPPLQTTTRTMPAMAMALKKLDQINWLTFDANYLPEHQIRSDLLDKSLQQVVQVLPPALDSCHETLALVVDFLTNRYPQSFTITPSPPTIHNHITGESFPIGADIANPLEVAARLSMEDFNILKKDAETGEYKLLASATLFPTGWKLQERIGSSMATLHAPVPGWKEKLSRSVDRYFDHLTPRSCMERNNTFIQTSPELFLDTPEGMFPHPSPLTANHIQVRRERQTFTRLVHNDAVLFTVRTFMRPLTELNLEETKAFATMVRGWEQSEMGRYKGSEVWGETALRYCDEQLAEAEL